MADTILQQEGTALTWQDSGGDYAITLASLAASAARQGAKGDLGATRAPLWSAKIEFDSGTAPTAGGLITLYLGWSKSGTAGTGNNAGLSGADAAYAGYSSNLADSLQHLGVAVAWIACTALGNTPQSGATFFFRPKERYVMPVIYNQMDQAFSASTTEHIITLTPIYDVAGTI